MKTKLTKEIEYSLIKKYCAGSFNNNCGALEVPVDYTLGKGKQNIDFALYKANKQDISCFEIKVTKSDFNSKASLSFVGNYNYLVVSNNLGQYLKQNWHNQEERSSWAHPDIPLHGIGVIVYQDGQLKPLIKVKRHEIHLEQKIALIEGILRASSRDAIKSYLNHENL